MKITDAVTSRL